MPIVSVVMPVYNAEEFLAESLGSYRENRTEDTELIVVDDGSTDSSLSIIERSGLASRIVRQSNKGPAAARNAALAQIESPYVAFLDADDVWPRGTLAALLDSLSGKPHSGVARGKVQTLVSGEVAPRLKSRIRTTPRYAVNLGSALFRTEALVRVEFLDANLRFDEDSDLWFRLWEADIPLISLDRVTLLYRLHTANMTRDAVDDRKAFLHLVKRHRDRTLGRSTKSAIRLAEYLGWHQDLQT